MEESKEIVKSWEKPWTTEEMRHQSANWNLAGDAGLLKHLQQFSQNLLVQTHATEVALDSLMEQLRATSTDVSNVTNQFLNLANTQFVENRVYDDDEKETPLEEKKETKPKSKEEQEAEVVARVREALALGMTVLDTMFDTVEVPASDSEDEESGGRVVLEPHNPYQNRPLPYLIGSRQFMEDDNVGLGSLSDSEENEADKNMIQSSESDSEMDIEQKDVPKKRTRLSSTSASENSEFGASDNSIGHPVPGKQKKMESSGLFDDITSTTGGNLFGGDSPADDDGMGTNVGARDSFAEQLAAKLGGVAAAEGTSQTAPKQRNSVGKPTLEWDQDGDDDGLFGRRDGKFSGGQGLFDDLDDSPGSLWGVKDKLSVSKGDKKPTVEGTLFGASDGHEDDNIFGGTASTQKTGSTKHLHSTATSTPDLCRDSEISNIKASPLFDGEDLDDGDLFSAPKPRGSVQVIADQQQQPPEESKKKKLAGAVSVFGGVDVFKAGVRRPPSSSSCSSEGSVPTNERAYYMNTSESDNGVGKSNSGQQDFANSKRTPAAASGKVLQFAGSDDLFAPAPSSTQSRPPDVARTEKSSLRTVTEDVTSDLFTDEAESDSLFSKPQNVLFSGQGTSAPAIGGKILHLPGNDDLFAPRHTSSQVNSPDFTRNERSGGKANEAVISDLFKDDATNDSLFSKPQNGLLPGSGKSANGGNATSKHGASSRKPMSLFNDSDSGDDELLFSSTSSTSSRSRRSQGSGDLLAAPGDRRPAAVQKKGLFDNEDDLFGATKDEPGFDIFGTGSNPVVKPTSLPNLESESEDLFRDRTNDPQFSLFKPSDKSVPATQEKQKNDSKDALFGDDDSFDIFSVGNDMKAPKSVTQVPVHNSRTVSIEPEPVKSKELLSNNSEDVVDDIFAIPVSKTQSERAPKSTLVDSLFSGGNVFSDSVDDLFAGPPKQKRDSEDLFGTIDFGDQTDDIFSVSRTSSNSQVAHNKVGSKDIQSASESESVADIFPKILSDKNAIGSLDLFSDTVDKSGSDLFSKSNSPPSTDKKPIIAKKPVVSQKPKFISASKPPLVQDSKIEKSDIFSSSSTANSIRGISQHSSTTSTKENSDKTAEKILPSDNVVSKTRKDAAESEKKSEVHALPVSNDEIDCANQFTKDSSVLSSKLEPPKTLNIRKTTSLLFSSPSNEDDGLFGMSFPSEVSLDTSSTEADPKLSSSLSALLQNSSVDIDKPVSLSTEKRSTSAKEISIKMDSGQGENSGKSVVKARSVGASPKQLNIDPTALLPGARPLPRSRQNAESAVSFDRPAQLNATLHSAGKDRARIQAKRRPPSRRARQEAVRTSGIDFGEADEADSVLGAGSVLEKNPNPIAHKLDIVQESGVVVSDRNSAEAQSPPVTATSPSKSDLSAFLDGSSNLLSPSTDEEDLFGVPQDLPLEYGNSKDDGQNLFTSAPVLSPLELPSDSLPTESDSIAIEKPVSDTSDKFNRSDIQSTNTLLEASLDKIPVLANSNISFNTNSSDVPNLGGASPERSDAEPLPEVMHDSSLSVTDDDPSYLFSVSRKVTIPSRSDKQELFGSAKDPENLFTSVNPIPRVDIKDYLVSKTETLPSLAENINPSMKDKLSEDSPLLFGTVSPGNVPESNSQDDLFTSKSEKLSDDLFAPRKLPGEKVNDLFSSTKADSSMHSDGGDDLFSSGKNISVNKQNDRTHVDASNIFDSKDAGDFDVLFSSGKRKQVLPSDDLFSSPVKETNTQKSAASDKVLSSDIFGGDSPESDDLFFSSSSKQKIGSSVVKGKPSAFVKSSVKGSLFDEDEDDDIFGGAKLVKSSLSPKPASVPRDNTDTDDLFASSSVRQKPPTKTNKLVGSASSRRVATDDDLFEDPLMVVTKK